MSDKQYRDKIAAVKKEQATVDTAVSKARSAAANHRSEAARHLGNITQRTSESIRRSHQRAADAAEKRAVAQDQKAASGLAKLARLVADLATAETNLAREVQSTARRAEAARSAEARRQQQEGSRRREAEKRHARDLARLSAPSVIYGVHEVRAPRPEALRVLNLTANPELNLRVDVEVRQVQQAVKAALHRDQISIVPRVAATPEDLLDGLNDLRPHVVHFSGHGGDETLVFDNASIEAPEGREVTFTLLARALGATATPPVLVVLNGCDTLDGAEVLLDSTPVVVAMSASITDLAAAAFAARFYGAIAAAQPVQVALEQGALAVDFLGLEEGWKPNYLAREGVLLDDLVLVKVPEA